MSLVADVGCPEDDAPGAVEALVLVLDIDFLFDWPMVLVVQ